MPDQLQLRGGTTTEHNSFTGALREVTVDTTKKTLVVHDGSQAGGTPLMKESGATAASSVQIGTGGVERLKLTSSEVVVNETGASVDFRVEGDTEPNLIFVDASADRIGIGTSSVDRHFHVEGTDNVMGKFQNNQGLCLIEFEDTDTTAGNRPSIGADANQLIFFTGGSTRGGVDSSGRLGIGTTSQGTFNTNADDIVISGSANSGMTIDTPNTATGRIAFGDPEDNNAGQIRYTHSSNNMSFDTNGSEKMTLLSGGALLIGGTTSTGAANKLQIIDSTDSRMILVNTNAASSQDASIFFAPANAVTGGSIVCTSEEDFANAANRTARLAFSTRLNGDLLERLRLESDGDVVIKTNDVALSGSGTLRINSGSTAGALNLDGGSSNHGGEINLTGGSNGGRIQFRTGVGAGQQGEKMRLDENGRLLINGTDANAVHTNADDVIIGNTSASLMGLSIVTSTSGYGTLQFSDGGGNKNQGQIAYNHTSDSMSFITAETTKIVINTSGQVVLGSSSLEVPLQVHGTIVQKNDATSNTSSQLHFDNDTSGGAYRVRFDSNGSVVGSIQVNTTSTAYNTSSDYRLKENAVAISDGITRLKTLKPYRFNFKDDKSTTVDGFFAHEVTAVPEAITGTKDGVITQEMLDANEAEGKVGDLIYQQIDQSKLVPLLVAAVQELITKVETLEAA